MKKFVFAVVCTFALVGFVMADEFIATITKVQGNTVTYKKGGFGKKKDGAEEPKEEKADVTSDVKVAKGEFDKGDGAKGGGKGGKGGFALKPGDPIEKGLKNEMFSKIDEKGMIAQITTDDKGKITQILTFDFGGFGGKKDGAAKGGFAKGDGAAKGGFAKGAAKGDGK